MVIIAAAMAAPVVCDPDVARQLVEDAGLEQARIPAIQPNLLPGLARSRGDEELRKALERLCGEGTVALVPAERWEGPSFSAFSFKLTQSRTEGCVLEQQAVVLTVGVQPGEPLHVGLRGNLPSTITPFGACAAVTSYRDEAVVAGAGTPVRLVLLSDHAGATVRHRLVARRATPDGWHEQPLLDPAPQRLVDGQSGPKVTLVGNEDPWIVAYDDRTVDGSSCTAHPGQTVWRWVDGAWRRDEGRDALALLAQRGAWRQAGEAGWFLIVAQDIPADEGLLRARSRRLQRRTDEPLTILESADFPELNAGFLFVSPAPWANEDEARAAKRRWGRRTGAYVKRAWPAPDPCAEPSASGR